ncbi:hypothetical protein NP493_29g03021 [Ridgeia piscesae]|uniref:3-oxo-5-alpha-steroid 4-dehydrogenase C-terminal domain-containing protein n=1 Tax=Ridgeia piscesae TaxID=27915 RepID=A0AAD9UK42_RIDPI|nr:hypothetical protein NP493_29g03021 [Ridgeia piscesae]
MDGDRTHVVRDENLDEGERRHLKGRGIRPGLLYGALYFVATATFLLAVSVESLPYLRFCFVGNLLPKSMLTPDVATVVVLVTMWGVHFVRRFAEVLFLQSYHRKVAPFVAIMASLLYVVSGFWIGWSLNFFLGYSAPALWILIPAMLVFAVGEVGNCLSHVHLERDAVNGTRASPIHAVVSMSALFHFISCPHYLFEIVTWLGFAMAAFTLPAFLFLATNVVMLLARARRRHLQWREDANSRGDLARYHPSRKAIIPFVF